MCSNIYKCTIFSCSSAAHPADFTRSRLQSGGRCGSHTCCVSLLKEWLSQAPPASKPCAHPKSKAGQQVTKGQSSFKHSASRIRFAHKVDGACNHMGKAGAELKLPQPPGCLVTALNEHFPNPAQLCNRSFSYSCEVALKDHKTPTSKTLDECFTSWILGCQPSYEREDLQLLVLLLLLVGILLLWSFFLLSILWV